MTRDELVARTRQLVAEGDRLQQDPSLRGLQTWLQLSDDLLVAAWGSMDRYHLAWLNVGRGSAPPGTSLDDAGTRRFIAEVASGKLAVLRTMRTSVERQGWSLLSDDDAEIDPTEENR